MMHVRQQIIEKLTLAFHPVLIDVTDESHLHQAAAGSESHFKVLLVSDAFAGQPAVRRHQMVYQQLAGEMANGLHALGLLTLTREEWQNRAKTDFHSPPCRGVMK